MTKILILEDEESIRSFIVINLKRNGFDVVEAANGNDAYQILVNDNTIDIALLDVMVPGIDGFEVCRRVRQFNERMGIIFPYGQGSGAGQGIRVVGRCRRSCEQAVQSNGAGGPHSVSPAPGQRLSAAYAESHISFGAVHA